ncbi:hypothetical protein D3C81_1894470 [compost metagenome]
MVDQLLSLLLIQAPGLHVTFDIDIKEGRSAAQGHRPAVLRFYRRQIGKVEPLHRFLSVHGWT